MQELPSSEIKKILTDLSTGAFPFERQRAAQQLGELPTTSEEVVRALAIAQDFDKDVEVRRAARQALGSAANQAFIKDNPDFLQKVIDSAEQIHAQEQQMEQAKLTDEFLRRRGRERKRVLLMIGGMFAWWGLFVWGLIRLESMMDQWLCPFQIGFFVIVGLAFWFSWRNWRCPACNSWLGGWTVQINPVFSPETISCPHCGKRLL